MSQTDMNVANGSGATVRADINAHLQAIVENSSGATAPTTTFANQWWADTSASILKRRNNANTAWISVMSLTTGLIIGTDIQAYDANTGRVGTLTVNTTTGGASIDVAIPSWVKHIRFMGSGISTTGTSAMLLQIGDSGGIETTGYTGALYDLAGAAALSSGFTITRAPTAAGSYHIIADLSLLDSATNTWMCDGHTVRYDTTQIGYDVTGSKVLSAALTTVRLTTAGGSDTFDANSGVNVVYWG